jgi:L-asparaginase II
VNQPNGVDLVEVVRSGVVESVHRGSLIVLGADGGVLVKLGVPDQPCFPRSSNKPLQAVGMLRAGLDLDGPDLAIAAASHSGEPVHVNRVRGLLTSRGLPESALGCPPDYPLSEQARITLIANGGSKARVFMNCSGKHSAMLLTCQAAGWPTTGYLDPGHPLQLALREAMADLAGEPVAAVGVDGCGAPLFGVSLTAVARAYARLVGAEPGTPERRVADAMRAHPDLVAGTGREDTTAMRAVPGLLLKGGAEGVHVGALADGSAFAVKVDDGAERARPPVIAAVLRRLGVDITALADLAEPPVLGGGTRVGTLRLRPGLLT